MDFYFDFETQKSLIENNIQKSEETIFKNYFKIAYECIHKINSNAFTIEKIQNKNFPENYVFTCDVFYFSFYCENSIENKEALFKVYKQNNLISIWTYKDNNVENIEIYDKIQFFRHAQEFIYWRKNNLVKYN